MDEHGFSGVDACVASNRLSPGGVHRRKLTPENMAS
jgi:hypothetical protein